MTGKSIKSGWLSTEDVAQLEGLTVRGIRKKIRTGKYTATREVSDSRGGRGGTAYEVHISALSQSAQDQFWSLSSRPIAPRKTTEINLLEYSEKAVEDYRSKKAMLEAAAIEVALAKQSRGSVKAARKRIASEYGYTVEHLYRLEREYARNGEQALLRTPGLDRPNARAMTPEMQDFAYREYVQQKRLKKKEVHRALQSFCAAHKLVAPSYATLARYLDSIPKNELTYGRRGVGAWRVDCEPLAERDYDSLDINSLWCGDHRQFDVFCKVLVKGEVESYWRVLRPWITMWLDLKSWCIVGWHISTSPNSQTIALALRHGILRYGLPEGIYVDCGKDYRSYYLSGGKMHEKSLGAIDLRGDTMGFLESQHVAVNAPGILSFLGVAKRHSRPVNKLHPAQGGVPRAKPIESSFNWFPNRLEHKLPGWCGNKSSELTEECRRAVKAIDPLLTLEEFAVLVEESIDQHNAERHGDRPLPAHECYTGVQVARIQDERVLDILLMRSEKRMVHNQTVRLNGRKYKHADLADWNGENVQVLYDNASLERVVIMSLAKTPQYICVAECTAKHKLSWQVSEKEMKALYHEKKDAAEHVAEAIDSHDTLGVTRRLNTRLSAGKKPSKVYKLRSRGNATSVEATGPPAPKASGNVRHIRPQISRAADELQQVDRTIASRAKRRKKQEKPAYKLVNGRWVVNS
jgi:putative transposase